MAGVVVSKLNDAAVKRWLNESVERDYRDARYPELRLRAISKRSKASVFLVLNRGGKTEWEKLGQWPSICVKTLASDLPTMLAKRQIGKMVTGQFYKVADLLAWYVSHIENNSTLSSSWRNNSRSIVKCHLIPKLGDVVLSDLSFICIDSKLIKPMLADDLSPNYIAEVVKRLKTAFSSAANLRLIGVDLVAGYSLSSSINLNKVKDTNLFEADLSELFSRLHSADMPVRMLFVLMMMFGTRINETRQARWEHFAGDVWVIPASHSKNKQEHRVPLTASAKALLDHYRKWQLKKVGKRFVLFPGNKGPVSIRTVHNWNKSIRFKHFTSHDLRILFRTMIAELGVDTVIGERLVNHALPILLRTYVKSTLDKGMALALEQYHSFLIDRGFSSVAPEILPRSTMNDGNTQSAMASGWL